MPIDVLVVAGGTEERIDDVRTLVNDRPHGFGLALAKSFHDGGADVRLLAGKRLRERSDVCSQPALGGHGYFKVAPFTDHASLRDSLEKAITKKVPDMVVMAASVSDWILSDRDIDKYWGGQDELSLRFLKAPKLIRSLRERCGPKTVLVGTVSVPEPNRPELLSKACKLMAEAVLDMVIAFDRRSENGDDREILVVTPEGGVVPFRGPDFDLAPMVTEFIAKRQRVTPVPMWQGSGTPDAESAVIARRRAERLISFSKSAGSYSGTSGNMSVRLSATDMLVSPSGVDKRLLKPEDLVFVQYDPTEASLSYSGDRKPSIDTNMQSAIYRTFPHIESIFHVHADAGLFLTDAATSFPFPCGTREEADDLIATVKNIGKPEAPFSVELIHHGYMLGLEPGGAERIGWEWQSAAANWIGALYGMKLRMMLKELNVRPIFDSTTVVGVIAEHFSGNWSAAMLLPQFRKSGLGERLAVELVRLGKPIKAHPDAEMDRWLCTHGWRAIERGHDAVTFIPPTARPDLGHAATICLVEPATRRVLLGKRKHSPWKDAWACPGGMLKLEEMSMPFSCARRELREETGINLTTDFTPAMIQTTFVGTYRGSRACQVTSYVLLVDRIADHHETDELTPQVFDIDEAIDTLTLGRGTKALLRKVQAALNRLQQNQP